MGLLETPFFGFLGWHASGLFWDPILDLVLAFSLFTIPWVTHMGCVAIIVSVEGLPNQSGCEEKVERLKKCTRKSVSPRSLLISEPDFVEFKNEFAVNFSNVCELQTFSLSFSVIEEEFRAAVLV